MDKKNVKIKSVMFGHAVADALGVPVEFQTRTELLKNPVTDMRGYGTYPVPTGTWSDDTSMALAALDSLANGKIDLFEIMINFVKWLDEGAYTATGETFDVGGTCKRAILNFIGVCYSEEKGFFLPTDFDVTECGLGGKYSNGNGALMRIHPFVLMKRFYKSTNMDLDVLIEKATSLTHAHERSILASKIYARVLWELLETPKKESILHALHMSDCIYSADSEYHHFIRLFDQNFSQLRVEEIKSTGYVVDTLEAAIWCVLTTDSYQDCVLKAVNLGEDTDTVAAVAGGLAGALYGYENIPQKWLDQLICKEYIDEMCERASLVWNARR